MGKKPKRGSAQLLPFEVDLLDAMQALESADSHHLGLCVLEMAENTEKIANRLETARLEFSPRPPVPMKKEGAEDEPPVEQEWESTSAQLEAVLEAGNAEGIGCYLRDMAKVLGKIGHTLAPAPQFRWPRLEFAQRGRGRRPDPKKVWKDAAICRQLYWETLNCGKQEAAIEMRKGEISRASQFRAKSRFNNKSHKKR